MNKLNILIISEFFFPDNIGGAGKVAYYMATGLQKRDHNVTVLTRRRREDLPKQELFEGIRISRYETEGASRLTSIYKHFTSSVNVCKTVCTSGNFDIINIHQPLAAFGILKAGGLRNIPLVYTFHSPWPEEYAIDVRSSGRTGMWSGLYHLVNTWIRRKIEKDVITSCHKVNLLSTFMKKKLQLWHQVSDSNISIIPGGVDEHVFCVSDDRMSLRDKLDLPRDKLLLFTIRNLRPRMGLHNLIEAVSGLARERKDFLLVIGGKGVLEEELKDYVLELGIGEFVRFAGFIPENLLPGYFQTADFFVLPTEYLEGFGLVTLEALSCGTPVLGTPAGATPEILGKLGPELIARCTDTDSLKLLLSSALEKYGELDDDYQKLREKCREFVLKHYTWDKIVDEWESEFYQLAG